MAMKIKAFSVLMVATMFVAGCHSVEPWWERSSGVYFTNNAQQIEERRAITAERQASRAQRKEQIETVSVAPQVQAANDTAQQNASQKPSRLRQAGDRTMTAVGSAVTKTANFVSDLGIRVDNHEYQKMMAMRPVGSPFTTALFYHYRNAMDSAREQSLMWNRRHQIMRKARMAAEGDTPMPEKPEEWDGSWTIFTDLFGRRNRQDNPVEIGHKRLLLAMNRGAREVAPQQAAAAQAAYDCWVINGAKNSLGLSCADTFKARLLETERLLAKMVDPLVDDAAGRDRDNLSGSADLPALAPDEMLIADLPDILGMSEQSTFRPLGDVALQDVLYLVFFDFNKSSLNASAEPILDAIAEDVDNRPDLRRVVVIGHTDTSGSASYNERLSRQRAQAVRTALSQRGVPAEKVTLRAAGESQLRVPTDDNTREPANRRAEITFE